MLVCVFQLVCGHVLTVLSGVHRATITSRKLQIETNKDMWGNYSAFSFVCNYLLVFWPFCKSCFIFPSSYYLSLPLHY